MNPNLETNQFELNDLDREMLGTSAASAPFEHGDIILSRAQEVCADAAESIALGGMKMSALDRRARLREIYWANEVCKLVVEGPVIDTKELDDFLKDLLGYSE